MVHIKNGTHQKEKTGRQKRAIQRGFVSRDLGSTLLQRFPMVSRNDRIIFRWKVKVLGLSMLLAHRTAGSGKEVSVLVFSLCPGDGTYWERDGLFSQRSTMLPTIVGLQYTELTWYFQMTRSVLQRSNSYSAIAAWAFCMQWSTGICYIVQCVIMMTGSELHGDWQVCRKLSAMYSEIAVVWAGDKGTATDQV